MTSKAQYNAGTEGIAPNITRVNKSRRMRWLRYVAPKGEKRGAYGVLLGKHT